MSNDYFIWYNLHNSTLTDLVIILALTRRKGYCCVVWYQIVSSITDWLWSACIDCLACILVQICYRLFCNMATWLPSRILKHRLYELCILTWSRLVNWNGALWSRKMLYWYTEKTPCANFDHSPLCIMAEIWNWEQVWLQTVVPTVCMRLYQYSLYISNWSRVKNTVYHTIFIVDRQLYQLLHSHKLTTYGFRKPYAARCRLFSQISLLSFHCQSRLGLLWS